MCWPPEGPKHNYTLTHLSNIYSNFTSLPMFIWCTIVHSIPMSEVVVQGLSFIYLDFCCWSGKKGCGGDWVALRLSPAVVSEAAPPWPGCPHLPSPPSARRECNSSSGYHILYLILDPINWHKWGGNVKIALSCWLTVLKRCKNPV